MATNIYDPYKDIKEILNAGKSWEQANAAGDVNAKNKLAENAQQFYNNLKNNGYSDLAAELSSSNTAARQKIADTYAQKGKTAVRPYFYEMGKQYGLSTGDIDNLLSYNNDTGEVSFAGTNMGTGNNVNGTTYWDSDNLNDYFTKTMNRIGQYKTADTKIGEADKRAGDMIERLSGAVYDDRNKMTSKYGRLENYNYETNPYETEIGKSIMDGYRWNGTKSSNNEIASGAGNNSGNIDSFSAANAARQQLAFETAGKQAVLNDFNSRVANAQNILAGLGGYLNNTYNAEQGNIGLAQNEAQRLFDDNQTALNNDVARETQKSQVTGYVPEQWVRENNPYFDKNGKLISPDVDYAQMINEASEKLKDTNLSAQERNNLEWRIRYANDARNFKATTIDKYKQFINTLSPTAPIEINSNRQAQLDRDYGKTISLYGYDTEKELADKNLENTRQAGQNEIDRINAEKNANKELMTENAKYGTAAGSQQSYKPTLTAAQAEKAIQSGNITQGVIDDYNYYYKTSYTIDNPPQIAEKTQTNVKDSEKEKWMKYINTYIKNKYGKQMALDPQYSGDNPAFTNSSPGAYVIKPQFRDILIRAVLKDETLSSEQAKNLLSSFGVTDDNISAVVNDPHYRD